MSLMVEDDILSLNKMIRDVLDMDELVYAVVIDQNRMIKAHTDHSLIGSKMPEDQNVEGVRRKKDIVFYEKTMDDGSRVLNLIKPVRFGEKALGSVMVGISLDFIHQLIRNETKAILILGGLIIALGILVAILLGHGFSRPINTLVNATREIGKGNFNLRLKMERKDELGHLANSFNFMAQELHNKQQVESCFGRYVSQDVARLILSNPEKYWLEGSVGEASILFTDIRGFTAYTEKNDPSKVVQNLNQYFEIVTHCVLKYGGRIDKFVGDAVLAVFGVPVYCADHALRAAAAAEMIQEELQGYAGQSDNPLLAKVGVSIDSGNVLSGTLGSKVKMEYTVIGDRVNVASRLNSLAKAGEILISGFTFDHIQDKVMVTALPSQQLRGKSQPVRVYKMDGLKDGVKITPSDEPSPADGKAAVS